ncbi:hypothetical protein, partial [Ruania albidiflava]|uniref:hypothetical protein n=1 Tax=Ruania albidiflava TaxID=366586 RepID=UPI00146E2C6E
PPQAQTFTIPDTSYGTSWLPYLDTADPNTGTGPPSSPPTLHAPGDIVTLPAHCLRLLIRSTNA